jgi:hypothetical protein
VAAPFGRTIAEGLQKVGADCVQHCPTGALVFREKKTGRAEAEISGPNDLGQACPTEKPTT